MEDWKKKTLVLGAVIGLVGGIVCAQIMIGNAEEKDEKVHLNIQQGAKLGMALYQAVKNIA